MATTIDLTNYNALVDDDGSNLVGSLIDKAKIASVILTPVQAAVTTLDAADAARPLLPGTSNPTTTGTQTALAIPAGTGSLVIYANNATLLTVQGIAAGLDGQLLTIFSKGAGQIDFAHLHASGTALGRLKLVATSGLTSLAAGAGVALFQYDATVTQWRLVAHEQGDWITPAYAGGDFTASGGMTWTVDSGDRVQYEYYLRGRQLHVAFQVNTSTVATPFGSTLNIHIPAGFTVVRSWTTMGFGADNGARVVIFILPGGVTSTGMAVVKLDGTNWVASTNNTTVQGIGICRVD